MIETLVLSPGASTDSGQASGADTGCGFQAAIFSQTITNERTCPKNGTSLCFRFIEGNFAALHKKFLW
jgi:hypothetical protein